MHPLHLNCVLLDTGSGCASPLSIDGVAFGVGTWSTSRVLMVQVGQTVLDRYMKVLDRNVTWLTKHKDTLDMSTRYDDTWLPLY